MYRTKDYMTWRNGETWNVLAQMIGRPTSQRGFTGPVFITVAMRRPRANSDLDNRIKGILDLLAHTCVIKNDKDVMGLNMFWSLDLPHGVAAEISIVEADAQEQAV